MKLETPSILPTRCDFSHRIHRKRIHGNSDLTHQRPQLRHHNSNAAAQTPQLDHSAKTRHNMSDTTTRRQKRVPQPGHHNLNNRARTPLLKEQWSTTATQKTQLRHYSCDTTLQTLQLKHPNSNTCNSQTPRLIHHNLNTSSGTTTKAPVRW